MAKKIMMAGVLMFLVHWASAQRFEGGLIGGLNASQVSNDMYQGYHKPGILAGFYVQTDVAPAVFAGMEIKYSQKGSRKRIKPKSTDFEKYVMRLGYVDVPFFMGFRTSDRGSVVAGISGGFLMHAREFNNDGAFPREDQNAFNDFDLQPFLGFKFDFLEQVTVDLRMAYSVLPLREVQGEEGTTSYWLNNQFNNVISLALYYRIDR